MHAALSPDVERTVEALTAAARDAARVLAGASSTAKDAALSHAAARLRRESSAVLAANKRDIERTRVAGETAAFIERLTLTTERIEAMARGIEEVAALPDPVGETLAGWRRPNGLAITQVRVPI